MFQDTVPDGPPGPAQAADSATPSQPVRSGEAGVPRHHLGIRFTGSGSEYFRIWIVNLLLIVLTLGIYLPWAKVRRLQYFHGNTLVDDEPLGFHGNPRRMLRGYLLVGLLFLLYSAAGQFSTVAGLVALCVVAIVAPALFRAAMQFRLANSSWRGLRFHFSGSLAGVYALLLPVALVLVAFIGGPVAIGMTARGSRSGPSAWIALWVPVIILLSLGSMLWGFWRLKKYQHDHYGLGSLQTRLYASFRQFVGFVLRLIGVSMLASLLMFPALGVVMALGRQAGETAGPLATALLTIVPFTGSLLALAVIKPYAATRMQNLVWGHTGSAELQFRSVLRFKSMLWLTLRNWLLIILTLGLYWPFAAIAMARLRLEAVSVATRVAPDVLVNTLRNAEGDAVGDAAGDLFGLDIGL